ncbi:transcription repressor OFP13 [Punica granatum]|uniref:Transcription repressor n=2 Tax=Punica granatum TaxID=22663 RepID=A0A218XRS5_PUNGR|nr:transcription repressor OFP13 [Punica granatum]OWM87663.1 hypothetical protein CDL15_Pgr022776 [Punica granatum]PKI43025.1 hypothetical protein CRG98_036603 [Punica granatum]
MGKKKMNLLPALFSSKNRAETGQPRQWASCKHPKTLSFRAGDDNGGEGIFKTVNSIFFDPSMNGIRGLDGHSPEAASWLFTSTSESASYSTEVSEDLVADESLEVLVRGARSDRLFFEPQGDTSSIIGHPGSVDALVPPFKESVVLAMESENPYVDFRRSMEEMVESNGIKDWECLEELLGWYLRMNGKENHGFIVEAFIDLLLNLSKGTKDDSCGGFNKNMEVTSFSSAASSFSDDSSSDPSVREENVAGINEEEKTMMTITSVS